MASCGLTSDETKRRTARRRAFAPDGRGQGDFAYLGRTALEAAASGFKQSAARCGLDIGPNCAVMVPSGNRGRNGQASLVRATERGCGGIASSGELAPACAGN